MDNHVTLPQKSLILSIKACDEQKRVFHLEK